MRPFGSSALAAALVALAFSAPALPAQQRDTTRAPRPGAPPRPAAPRDTTRADTARADSTRAVRTRRRAQPRARRAATGPAIPDSLLRPPISPRRAFVYSLVLPGQGQKSLRRPRAAAFFGTVELGSIFMLLKSQNDLRLARSRRADSVFLRFDPPAAGSTDSVPVYEQHPLVARIRARRLHVEDWVATIIFNHLISGAEAFVAAQLWDLPAQVSFEPAPRGLTVRASVAW